MSRGTKLDIFIGVDMQDGWQQLSEPDIQQARFILKPHEHSLTIKKEKRRGKTVTLIGEFYINDAEIQKILKNIKRQLGCGGTYKDGWMQLQGDIKDLVLIKLKEFGFNF